MLHRELGRPTNHQSPITNHLSPLTSHLHTLPAFPVCQVQGNDLYYLQVYFFL
ncbi:MAG: hypothetical protein WB696_24975 [Chthoniobacterales bacterium]